MKNPNPSSSNNIDIAGPSYNKMGESYKPAGGTGFGVRLLSQFLKYNSN
ncbi:MAG: hypothetical protein WD426_13485 [Anditalea sp.]